MSTSTQPSTLQIVVIGDPKRLDLDEQKLIGLIRALPTAHRSKLRALKEGAAYECAIVPWNEPDTSSAAVIDAIEQYVLSPLREAGFDAVLLQADAVNRRKKVLVADMESTIIEQEMLDELGDLIGKRTVIEDITARAMRGEIDFEQALGERVAMLAGLDASVLDEVSDRITIMPGARELVATMKANGAYCALVSGGFTFFTERIAHMLGFDEHQANTLEIANGKITGRVTPPILGRDAKLTALKRIAARQRVDLDAALAVGDGANDLAMLGAAGVGVAYHAKPMVREAVLEKPGGAVITNGDLTALLYLQGYAASDFAPKA